MTVPNQLVANTRAARARRPNLLRTIAFVVIIVVVLLGIGYVIFHTGYTHPLSLAPYPNATLSATSSAPGVSHEQYTTTDAWDTVGHYYALTLGDTETQSCRLAGDQKMIHCIIDQITLGNEQTVQITINPDPANGKQTQITIDRTFPAS